MLASFNRILDSIGRELNPKATALVAVLLGLFLSAQPQAGYSQGLLNPLFDGQPFGPSTQGVYFDSTSNTIFRIDHIEGEAIGQVPAQSTFGVTRFVPSDLGTVLFDGQMLITNNAEVGANLGIVGRFPLTGGFYGLDDYLIGLGGWYDVTQSARDNFYQWGGFSFELLGPQWRARINGYLSLDNSKNVIERTIIGTPGSRTPAFAGNNIITGGRVTELQEAALGGLDYEVARALDFLGHPNLEVFFGWYNFYNSQVSIDGPMGGVRGYLLPQLAGEVTLAGDDNGATVFGGLTLFFGPTGNPTRTGVTPTMPVRRRRQVIVREREVVTADDLMVFTTGGRPVTVTHVNDDGMLGSGTFEDPHGLLVAATGSTSDIVYLHADSVFMNQYYDVAPGQRLLGEAAGVTHLVVTDQGTITLPRATTGTAAPIITNSISRQAIITAASGSEISTLVLDGMNSARRGVYSPGAISNVNLNRLTIRNMTTAGISLGTGGNVSGTNVITGVDIDDIGLAGFGVGTGIELANLQAGATTSIRDFHVANTVSHGISVTSSDGTTSISGAVRGEVMEADGDGIAINDANVNIDNVLIRSTGGVTDNGVQINNGDNNRRVAIIDSIIDPPSGMGIAVNINGLGTLDLTVTGTTIESMGDAFNLQMLGDGDVNLTFDGNTAMSLDGSAFVFNAGSSSGNAMLNVNGNTFDAPNGQGVVISAGLPQVMIGTNFTGTTSLQSPFIPPDTIGAVGLNHIVELLNGRFAVYDKTGTQLTASTLDAFWLAAGATIPSGFTFDPRIIYDAASDRWIATSINGGAGNTIFIAVSDTGDPTGTWSSVQFIGDTVDGTRFNDYDTLGVDGDSIIIATNNFGVGFDVSVYNIPLADLVGGAPTLANLTRFEALPAGTLGSSIQGVVSSVADGTASLLSTDAGGSSSLNQTTITGAAGGGATLGGTTNIGVGAYAPAPLGRQPGPDDNIENVSPRFTGNVVEVGGKIYAVHAIDDGGGDNSAIRFYEIDATTNTVLQEITISDPTQDYLDPSVAVNAAGDVVIGFSLTSDTQFISSAAVVGTTAGGVTTFSAPVILQPGAATYFEDFGSGRNRWGDYSATVVDPADPSTFWTIQEFAFAQDEWGIQITELNVTTSTGAVTIQGFNGNTVASAGTGGVSIRGATFDSNPAMAGNQTVMGGDLNVGSAATRVTGAGVSISGSVGSVSFDNLNVYNTGGRGLSIAASAPGDLSCGSAAGTVDTTMGPAIDLDTITAGLTLDTVNSTMSPSNGVVLDQVMGTVTINGGNIDGTMMDAFNIVGSGMASNLTVNVTGMTIGTMTGLGGDGIDIDTATLNLNGTTIDGATGFTIQGIDSVFSGSGNSATPYSGNDLGGNSGSTSFNGGADTFP